MSQPLQNDERQTMREHILFLGKALEQERANSVRKTRLLQRMLDPEDLGWAVSHEVRMIMGENAVRVMREVGLGR